MFKLPEDLENKYRFVTLASKRAEQLQTGAPARVGDPERKTTVLAQEEVAEGLIDLWDPSQEEIDVEGGGVEEEEEE
jgi:DNA-directed RNA polymerase omega subunit